MPLNLKCVNSASRGVRILLAVGVPFWCWCSFSSTAQDIAIWPFVPFRVISW